MGLRDEHAIVAAVVSIQLHVSRGPFNLLVLVDSQTVKVGFVVKGHGPYAFACRIIVNSRTMPWSAVNADF